MTLPLVSPERRVAAILLDAARRAAQSPVGIDRRSGCGWVRFYDALETRDPAEREAALMAALPQIIAAAKERAPAYRGCSPTVQPEDIADRRALGRAAGDPQIGADRAAAAATRRSAGFNAAPVAALGAGLCLARADLRARRRGGPISFAWPGRCSPPGFRAGDLVHNAFSYHLTPAGAMVESARRTRSAAR